MGTTELIKSFTSTIELYERENLPKLLEAHNMSPAKFTQIVITEVKKNTKMQEAFLKNPQSLFASIFHCAELGLNPSEHIGHFYFIPFKGGIKPILGYKGLVTLILRSGNIKKISCEIVYEGDDFEYELGLEPKLSHIPNFDADRSSENIRWVYAVAKTTDDEYIFKVMTRKEIMDIAKMGDMRNSLYFNEKKDPQNWMAKKVVIKQLSKLLPKDYYGQRAVAMDDVVEGGGYITTNELNEVELVEEKSERPKKAGIYSTLLREENLNS